MLIVLSESIYVYNLLPQDAQVPSHWNIYGNVDGKMEKGVGLFLLPGLLTFISLILIGIPYIDPLQKNIEKFKPTFNLFIFSFSIFFLLIHTFIILSSLKYNVPISFAITPGLAFLFYVVGVLTKNAKRNYFIGIRTPWTLNSDIVWDKTHDLAGTLFKSSSIIILIGVFLDPLYSFVLTFGTIILTSIIAVVYSYLLFLKEKK
ncbi:MAG: SdpI family protein [Bacteroidetes bacterium]|nr:SdpI family protein [Bacteroidota bacterium]